MNRRDWVKSAFLTSSAFGGLPLKGAELGGGNDVLQVEIEGSATALWRLRTAWGIHRFAPPIFAINRKNVAATLTSMNRVGTAQRLINGVYEHSFSGQFAEEPGLVLEMIFRIAPQSPVVRFRYVVRSKREHRLTGDGAQLSYLQVSFAELPQCREVQLSVFNDMLHSYTASELEVSPRQFADGLAVIGPIVVGTGAEGRTLLLGYEHGAEIPDAFLEFRLTAARQVELRAKKANYVPGQLANGYSTVWMQTAAGREGADKLAARYRRFVLEDMSLRRESRRPYIFYNTWNFQERNKWWNGKPYLHSMNSGRILGEIDAAHRMGIDVFVLDTGWYEKTGDWEASRERFPGGLAAVQGATAAARHEDGAVVQSHGGGEIERHVATLSPVRANQRWSRRQATSDLGDRRELSHVFGESVQRRIRGEADPGGAGDGGTVLQVGRDWAIWLRLSPSLAWRRGQYAKGASGFLCVSAAFTDGTSCGEDCSGGAGRHRGFRRHRRRTGDGAQFSFGRQVFSDQQRSVQIQLRHSYGPAARELEPVFFIRGRHGRGFAVLRWDMTNGSHQYFS